MAKEYLTDEQVEREIERLRESEYVRLARKAQKIKYQLKNKRRQVMYCLRTLDKHGKELAAAGITFEMLQSIADIGELEGC